MSTREVLVPRPGEHRLAFDDVERLIRRSVVGSATTVLVHVMTKSVERSRILHTVRATLWAGVGRDARVRSAAVLVVSAATSEALLTRLVPEASAPAVPPVLWLLVAAAATVPASAPQIVVAAWDSWKRRRYRSDDCVKPGPPAAT
jgi:hypothetical protein